MEVVGREVSFFFVSSLTLTGDRAAHFYGAPFIGNAMASRGCVCVTVSYRTSDRFPAHAKDVAAALKWVRELIEIYGGDPNKIFLSGHSAGGHLASLLATDHRYLEEHSLEYTMIKGTLILVPAHVTFRRCN